MRSTTSKKASAQLFGDAAHWSSSSSSQRAGWFAPKCGYVTCQFIWSTAAVQCCFFAPGSAATATVSGSRFFAPSSSAAALEYCALHIARMIGRIEGWTSAQAAAGRSTARFHPASAKAEKIIRGDFFGDEAELKTMQRVGASFARRRVKIVSGAGNDRSRACAGVASSPLIMSLSSGGSSSSSRGLLSSCGAAAARAHATAHLPQQLQMSLSGSFAASLLADPRRNLFRPTGNPRTATTTVVTATPASFESGSSASVAAMSPAVVAAVAARTQQLHALLQQRQQQQSESAATLSDAVAAAAVVRRQWEGALRNWLADTGRLASMLRSHDGSLTAHRLERIRQQRAEALLHPRDYDAAVAVRHAWTAAVYCGLWREALAVGAPPLLVASALSCAGPRQTKAAVSAYALSFVARSSAAASSSSSTSSGRATSSAGRDDHEEYVTSSSLGCYLASEAARASAPATTIESKSGAAARASWKDALFIVTLLNYRGYVVRNDFHVKLGRLVAMADGGGNWAAATRVLQQVCFESDATFNAWTQMRRLMLEQQKRGAGKPSSSSSSVKPSEQHDHDPSAAPNAQLTVRQAVSMAARLLHEGKNRDAFQQLHKNSPSAAKTRLIRALEARKHREASKQQQQQQQPQQRRA